MIEVKAKKKIASAMKYGPIKPTWLPRLRTHKRDSHAF